MKSLNNIIDYLQVKQFFIYCYSLWQFIWQFHKRKKNTQNKRIMIQRMFTAGSYDTKYLQYI